jgi:hypothetical protein
MRPLSLLAIVLFGCATGDGMETKLRDATAEYNRSLRWADLDHAITYIPPESVQQFLDRYDEYDEELVVLDHEVTRLDLDKKTGVAASRATIWWHTDDSTIVETTVVDQLWQFHEGNFVLVDERRSGGTRLGVFAERGGAHPYLPGLMRYRKAHDIGEDKRKRGRHKPPEKPSIRWPAGDPMGEDGPPLDAIDEDAELGRADRAGTPPMPMAQ